MGGSLNANDGTWANDITGTGTLIVDRQYTTKAGANITYTVTARDLTLSAASGSATTTNIGKNVTVSNNMTVATASSQTHTVNIASGATVNVGTSLTRGGSDTAVINVNGTLVVAENNTTANTTIGNVTINVLSANTLRAGGVLSNVILNIGDASNAGRAIIRSMNGGTLALVKGSLEVNAGAELDPGTVTTSGVQNGFTVTFGTGVEVNAKVGAGITGTAGVSTVSGTYTAGGTADEDTFTTSAPATKDEDSLVNALEFIPAADLANSAFKDLAPFLCTGLTIEKGEGDVLLVKGKVVSPTNITFEALKNYDNGATDLESAKSRMQSIWGVDITEEGTWGFIAYGSHLNSGDRGHVVLVKYVEGVWKVAAASGDETTWNNEVTFGATGSFESFKLQFAMDSVSSGT